MPLVVKDRVRETTTTTGTGTITLAGAVAGFQSFSAIGNANTTYYTINLPGANEWEVGLGTYTASGTTLSRDTILASSNGGSAVNFSAGTKDVFCTYPAGKSAYLDASNNLLIGTTTNTNTSNIVANGTISETVSSTQYLVASQFDVGTNPNQIPLNQYLGDMAFQSSAGVSVGILAATTIDTTNLEVTNIKAKDGTAAIVLTDSTGAVTISTALTANGGAVFNEDSADIDFRVESDSNTHMLFVDGFNDAVGIGMIPLTTFGNRNSLEIGGNTVANVSLQAAIGETLYNFYIDGVGASKYATDGPAGFISFNNAVSSGWSFQTYPSGLAGASAPASTDLLALSPNGTIFNEGGADIDFRVESDTNTHALFVDAGNSRVGINNSNPTYALDVTGGIRASSLIQSTSSIDFEGSIGGVYLRPVGGSSTTTVEAHIRPQSGKKGYLTFTEDTVADRWAIGIENANSTLFFRPGQTSTAFSNYFTTDGTLGVKQAPGNYTVDVTDGQTSFANNATVDFPNASGMLVVNNHTDGSVTIYLCGGGGTSVVSTIGTQVGTFTYVSGISGYRWTNTYGSTAVFGFFFLRTRTTA